MKQLKTLWRALEDMRGTRAVLAEWQSRLGSDMVLAQLLLRPTDTWAGSFPDTSDPLASGYNVVEHSPDDIVGVPLDGGPTIRLQRKDVLIYRLDERTLGRRIAEALGIQPTNESLDGLPRTRRLGDFCPFAGYAFPVYLTVPHEVSGLLRVAESASSRNDGPFILIAPTARRMRAACKTLLDQRDSCFLSLEESITCDPESNWRATSGALQRIASFQRSVLPQAEDEEVAAFFPTPSETTWYEVRLRFIDRETLSIRARDVTRIRLYSDMGMASRKNRRPTKQWELLREFARKYGTLTWGDAGASRSNQKQREELSAKLRAFFRIDGDPIEYDPEIKGWRTRFALEPES